MGIGDSGILAVGEDLEATTLEMFKELVDDMSEIISIYYGEEVEEAVAEELGKAKKPGKNLIPFPYPFTSGTTQFGIRADVKDDGAIKLSGTCTAESVADFFLLYNVQLPSGTYTISGAPSGGGTYTYLIFVNILGTDGVRRYFNDKGSGGTFTVTEGETVQISIRYGRELGTVEALTFYPQLEEGAVATEYEPYKDPVLYQQALEKAGQIKTVMENLKEELS